MINYPAILIQKENSFEIRLLSYNNISLVDSDLSIVLLKARLKLIELIRNKEEISTDTNKFALKDNEMLIDVKYESDNVEETENALKTLISIKTRK